jgi:lipocalin
MLPPRGKWYQVHGINNRYQQSVSSIGIKYRYQQSVSSIVRPYHNDGIESSRRKSEAMSRQLFLYDLVWSASLKE